MEITNTTNAKETLLESAKMINKLSNDTAVSMMEGYKKQLSLMSDIYGNVFNFWLDQSKNMFIPDQKNTPLFFNTDTLKSIFTPLNSFGINGNFSNQFSDSFDKMVKQITDYNQKLIISLTKQFEKDHSEGSTLNEKYQKSVEKGIEESKHFINSLMETYNKRMDFTSERNKKLQEEINKQLDHVFKLNQQFWSEVLTINELPVTSEKSTSKEEINGNKKPGKKSGKI